MKKGLIILFALASCTTQETKTTTRKAKLDSLRTQYELKYSALPNEMQKMEFRTKYLDTINKFLADSMHFILGNTPVTITELKNVQIGDVKAFYVKYEDKSGNMYYTEYDYPISDDSSLKKNYAYKLLKDIPEHVDTTLSFFYLGGAEWNDTYGNELKIRVTPFPKDFNYDSSKNANRASARSK